LRSIHFQQFAQRKHKCVSPPVSPTLGRSQCALGTRRQSRPRRRTRHLSLRPSAAVNVPSALVGSPVLDGEHDTSLSGPRPQLMCPQHSSAVPSSTENTTLGASPPQHTHCARTGSASSIPVLFSVVALLSLAPYRARYRERSSHCTLLRALSSAAAAPAVSLAIPIAIDVACGLPVPPQRCRCIASSIAVATGPRSTTLRPGVPNWSVSAALLDFRVPAPPQPRPRGPTAPPAPPPQAT
jgi:hypothetical protein